MCESAARVVSPSGETTKAGWVPSVMCSAWTLAGSQRASKPAPSSHSFQAEALIQRS